MELTIYWTAFSKNELKNIFNYYKEEAGLKVAKNLVSGIAKETLKLKKHPTIGQKEELLKNRPEEFRYLVYKNYKIIYLIHSDKNTIEIFDVFDTRQNPTKMGRIK
jgi:plasmid stabilization system protein ParE